MTLFRRQVNAFRTGTAVITALLQAGGTTMTSASGAAANSRSTSAFRRSSASRWLM